MNIGGVEQSLLNVLNALDNNKYEVDLVLFEEIGEYKDKIPNWVNIIELDIRRTEGAFLQCIITALKGKNWDVIRYRLISIFCKKPSLLGCMKKYWGINKTYDCAVAYRFGISMDYVAYVVDAKKKITWWHNGEYVYSPEQTILLNKTIKKFDNVVFVSNACLNLAKENGLDSEGKSWVVPNFIDINHINQLSYEFNPYEKDDKTILVTVARLSPEKHIENVVFVSKRLVEEGYKSFKWYIVGYGIQYEILNELIKKHNLEDKVVLLGNQINPYPYIRYADIYVHTSYMESQGISVLEAMVLNKTCVITKSMGTNEFVVNGENAIQVEQNVDDLFDKTKYVLNNFDAIDQSHYQKDTVSNFSSDTVIKRIEGLLN